METQHFKINGMQQNSCRREVYSNTGLPQQTRKVSNKQPSLPPKRIRKMNKTQNWPKKENKDQRGNKIQIKLYRKDEGNQELSFVLFFKKYETGKLLARLTKEKRDKAKISKIRNERGEIITYATAIQKKSQKNTMNSCMPTDWTTQKK